MDNLNYGAGTQVLDTLPHFDPNQFNSIGQPTEQTPLQNNQPIANDYQNDQRDAMDVKRGMNQAKLDTLEAHDTEGKYVFKDGTIMDKTSDTRGSTAMQAAMGFFTSYMAHSGDINEAIGAGAAGAGQAVSAHEDRIKRESMIPQLEATGRYQTIDMMKWAETGATKDLIANQGKWQPLGDGWEGNTISGETRRDPNYKPATPKLTHIDLGNRDVFVDEQGNEVKSYDKGQSPDVAAKSGADGSLDNSGDDGTGTGGKADSSHMVITDPDGTVWHVAVNSRGTPIVDKKTGMATVYNENGETSSRVYNPTYTQQSGQLSQEINNNIDEITKNHSSDKTGSGIGSRISRAWSDVTGGNYTADTQAKFDTINDQMHALAVQKLIQEGVTPTEELVRAEIKRYGQLSINNSPEQNAAIMDKMKAASNAAYHAAEKHQTHTEMKDTDRSTPPNVAPTRASTATAAKVGKKDFSHMW
ncbi:hypothetical protein [Klebsiella pneumoniae]|nr:hypothetical protein [Klebsiella pneumoniae]